MFEYYWLRDYITLSSEEQIKNDLIKRTKTFNSLGAKGWELIPVSEEKQHFCFRRDQLLNKQYEYAWIRDFISPLSEEQMKRDLAKRTELFNVLASQGWNLVEEDLAMFCFIRECNARKP